MGPPVGDGEKCPEHFLVLAIIAHGGEGPLCFFTDEGVGVEGSSLEEDFRQVVQVGLHTSLQTAKHVIERHQRDLGERRSDRVGQLDYQADQAV